MTQTNPTIPPPPPLLEISTSRAISLARRWRWLSGAMWVALFLIGVGAMWAYEKGGGFVVVAVMFGLWTFIASMNARVRRLTFDAGQHFAAGEFDLAEDRLTQSLTAFTLAPSTKRFGLQQLAMIRHAQSRWADAAALARAFLSGSNRVDAKSDVASRLVLAESLLEMGDLDAVARELHALSALRLNLRETLTVTQLRLDLLARQGNWQALFQNPSATVGLIELLPAVVSARCHAMVALAARRLEQGDWYTWLAERAKLLGDVDAMVAARPYLREVLGPDDVASAGN